MKNYIWLLLGIFLLAGCEKETNEVHQDYPIMYYLYFELLDVEGRTVPNDQIGLSRKMVMTNGRLENEFSSKERWFKMGIISEMNNNLFGIRYDVGDSVFSPIIFESGVRGYWVKEGLEEPVKDWYYLFRNAEDNSKIDTLRIHDILTIDPYTRNFDFFLNEEPLELKGDKKFKDVNPNYVTIQLKR